MEGKAVLKDPSRVGNTIQENRRQKSVTRVCVPLFHVEQERTGTRPLRIWKRGRSPDGNDPNKSMMRRRATLPHPLECSTIAAPGLSYRVRNGTGRLTWAMTAAKPEQSEPPHGRFRHIIPTGHGRDRGGLGTGQGTREQALTETFRDQQHNAYCRREPNHRGTPRPHPTKGEHGK